jgi:hypothetical protein
LAPEHLEGLCIGGVRGREHNKALAEALIGTQLSSDLAGEPDLGILHRERPWFLLPEVFQLDYFFFVVTLEGVGNSAHSFSAEINTTIILPRKHETWKAEKRIGLPTSQGF